MMSPCCGGQRQNVSAGRTAQAAEVTGAKPAVGGDSSIVFSGMRQ